MFKLNYRIVEDYECLKEMDADTYDREWANIEGLIELQFEEDAIGYMYYDEITPEMYEAGCFQDELLISWFNNLLDTVVALHRSDYVTLSEIECPYIIEFSKQGEEILVREVRAIGDPEKDIVLAGYPVISTEKLKYIFQLKNGKKIEEEYKLSETNFKKVTIAQVEFEHEVLTKAIQFLDEVASQYPWLMPSRTFKSFEDKINKVKLLIEK